MACLDTSVLLDLTGRGGKRRQRLARARITALNAEGELLVTTRFNVAELKVGVWRSRDPERERDAVRRLLAPLGILEFDARAADAFGAIVATLKERGRPIGDMDALIAAVALSQDQRLVTGNPKHFQQVPDLRVETY
jgi:tRNA(fMet)-specific endonuclease VapC